MTSHAMEDGLMRISDAARFLGLGRSTVYALMDCGELPYVKLGKARRIKKADLVRLVERHTVTLPSRSK